MKRFQVTAVTAIALFSFSAACTKPGASDDAISNDIKAKLYSDAATKAADINVAVKDGTVTLSGSVPGPDVEQEAMKVANAAPGVKGVTDQLTVTAAAATPPNQLPEAGTPAGQTPAPPVSSPAPAAAPVAAPVRKPAPLTVPAGTSVAVRLIDPIDSGKNAAGQTFRASLSEPLSSGGRVVIPAGSDATVVLNDAKGAGRIKGSSSVDVRLASIQYRGETYRVDSSSVQQTGKGGRGKNTAIKTGIGAAAGALIGGLAGGGKGAAIGSAAGGGAGFGINAFTHGNQVKIPSETVLTFTLQAPFTVTREPR